MRLETLPVVLGVLFALAGLALMADAAMPDGSIVGRERRRRPRPQRNLWGEAALGLGIVAVGAVLIGRDVWRYSTVAVLVALIMCALGVAVNWRYMKGLMLGGTASVPDSPEPASPAVPAPEQERRMR